MIYQHIYGRTEGGYGDYLSSAEQSITDTIKPIVNFSFQGPDKTKESDYPKPLAFACIPDKLGVLSRSCYETGIRNEMYRHSYIFTGDDLTELLASPESLFSLDFTENISQADNININKHINYKGLPSPSPSLASIKNDLDLGTEFFSKIVKSIFMSANVGSRRLYIFHNESELLIRLLFSYLPPWIIEKTGFLTYDKSLKREEFDPIDFRIKLIFVEDSKSNRDLIKQKEQEGAYIVIPQAQYITDNSSADLFMSLIQEAYESNDNSKLKKFYDFIYSNTDKSQTIPYDAYDVFYKLFNGQSCMDYELRHIYPVCGYDLKNSVIGGYINMLREDNNSWSAVSQLKEKDRYIYDDILNEIFSRYPELGELAAANLVTEAVSAGSKDKSQGALDIIIETYEKCGDSVCTPRLAAVISKDISSYINPLPLKAFEKYILSIQQYPKARNDFFKTLTQCSIDLYLDEYFDAAERMKKQLTANLSGTSESFQKLLPENYIEESSIINDLQQMQNERLSLSNAIADMKKEAYSAQETLNKLKSIQSQQEKHIEVLNSDAKKIAADRETALYKRNEGKKSLLKTRNNEVAFLQLCLYFMGILFFGFIMMLIGQLAQPEFVRIPAIFNICFILLSLAVSFTFGMQRKQGVHFLINASSITTLVVSVLLIVTNVYAIASISPNTDTLFARLYKNTFGIYHDVKAPVLTLRAVTAIDGEQVRLINPVADIYDIEHNESIKLDIFCIDDTDEAPEINVKINDISTKYTSISSDELIDGLNSITLSMTDKSGNISDEISFTINKRMPVELASEHKVYCQIADSDGTKKIADNPYELSIKPGGSIKIFFNVSFNKPSELNTYMNGLEFTGVYLEESESNAFGEIEISYNDVLQENNELNFTLSTEDGDTGLFTIKIDKVYEQSPEVLSQ